MVVVVVVVVMNVVVMMMMIMMRIFSLHDRGGCEGGNKGPDDDDDGNDDDAPDTPQSRRIFKPVPNSIANITRLARNAVACQSTASPAQLVEQHVCTVHSSTLSKSSLLIPSLILHCKLGLESG